MKLKWNRILVVALVLTALVLVAGCAGQETPYEKNDALDYKVSVKFDANGGSFTTNTTVIVDSYNLSEAPTADGKAQIALITPDDSARGNNAFTATRTGYFLAGWYESCQSAEDGTQTYGNRWDFSSDLLSLDPNGSYSASEPVLTLYAAWVPLFEVELYDLDSKELLGEYTLNPETENQIKIPQWDAESGAVNMYKFPVIAGKTFEAAYYDEAGTKKVTEEVITHPGSLDAASATAENTVLKLYVDMLDGEWYHIYNADQFIKNASVSSSYVIHEDLDFEGKIWPTTLMYGNFSGTIQGNGHTISNVVIEQTNNSKTNAGLFGALTETASLSEVTFDNVSFTIKSGTRMAGTSYGLLAGTVMDGAVAEGVSVLNSTLTVGKDAYFGTDDYIIGSVCGMGELTLDAAQITMVSENENALLPTEAEATEAATEETVEATEA